MKLTLTTIFQSLSTLEADELPNFTLITGPNGSGKTHLLKGIEGGNILIDGVAKNTGGQARFFDSNSIVPTSTGTFTSQTLRNLRLNTAQQLISYQNQVRSVISQNLGLAIQNIRQIHPHFNLPDPLDYLKNDFISHVPVDQATEQYVEQLKNQIKEIKTSANSEAYLRNYGISPGFAKLAAQTNISVALLTENDLETEAIDLWGGVNVFQQNLGQLFVAYRDMALANSLKELAKSKTKENNLNVFTEEEFIDRYGQSPWHFVNDILVRAQLPFRINSPEKFSYEDFTPQLTKTTNGVKISFESLSSGEKVLMSFALCLYQARDGRQAIQYPEILLLDEIDAPLHPSMVKDLISTIKDVLVGEKNIKVIMTTHSPTTVAIAPEESIFVMTDSRSLLKTNKEAALALLTYGVPTLSISFDARRQVFVESRFDAGLYDELYRLLRPSIAFEKSLVFIAASGVEKNTETSNENGGSSVVRNLVQQLCTAGNTSVYGLIDWDTTSSSTERLKVLAKGRRYSLDTCLLDLCLLALLVIKENLDEARKLKLIEPSETYFVLASAGKERMQRLVDSLSTELGYSGEKIECRYQGGERLTLPKDFLHGNGHTQAKNALEKLSFLRAIPGVKNTEAGLLSRIAKNIVPDSVAWLPIEVSEVFTELSI